MMYVIIIYFSGTLQFDKQTDIYPKARVGTLILELFYHFILHCIIILWTQVAYLLPNTDLITALR